MTALDKVNAEYANLLAANEEVERLTAEANMAARTPGGSDAYVELTRELIAAIGVRQHAQENYARALTALRLEAALSGKPINATR